jgi:hypothetical protein
MNTRVTYDSYVNYCYGICLDVSLLSVPPYPVHVESVPTDTFITEISPRES